MALRGDDEKLLEMGFSRPWRDVAISVIAGPVRNLRRIGGCGTRARENQNV
jgi:uncharacterized protein YjeT (DUF2065 family)